MTITLKVPTIACEVCAKNITNAIKNKFSNAQISVDVTTKIVVVNDDNLTKDKLVEIISDAGHVSEN